MSVTIGGGYGTGRELVQFFMPAGPLGGLLGMAVAMLGWSIVFALSLDIARSTGSYDYRSFFQQLLGRGWVVFEFAYLALLLLILSVLGAACGEILAAITGVPTWVGTVVFIACIGALTWFGAAAIEIFFTAWATVLYLAYAAFFTACLAAFHDDIALVLTGDGLIQSGWMIGGLTYTGYNIAVAPALLFCARYQTRRRESLISGALAGPIAIIPGALFYFVMLARYPQIAEAPVPLQVLLAALDNPWFTVGMQIAIFGTLVQTGIGVLHGFNERLMSVRQELAPSQARRLRLAVSVAICLAAIMLATHLGLIDLIAKGYSFISWIILAVYVAPLLTIGVLRVWRNRSTAPLAAERISRP